MGLVVGIGLFAKTVVSYLGRKRTVGKRKLGTVCQDILFCAGDSCAKEEKCKRENTYTILIYVADSHLRCLLDHSRWLGSVSEN